MKKVIIAILVIMTVFCTSVFADDGYEDYSGLSVGLGYSTVTYTTKWGIEYNEKSNPLHISASEFAFFEGSPVGLYAEVALSIPLNFKRNGFESDNWLAGFYGGIGPAFRFETSNKVSIMLGAGFHFYTTTYSNNSEYWKDVRYYYGVGGELSASYKFSKHFAMNAGFGAAVFFANSGKRVYKYFPNDDISFNSYSEVRVIPKISVYYVY